MKRFVFFICCCLSLSFVACKSSTQTADSTTAIKEDLREKNRVNLTLLAQIRQLPGVTLRRGVPVFNKTTSTIATVGVPIEPLYVLNDYIVGNSFASVNQLVDNVNVKDIETLTGHEASFYGSRASNGVIKITTYQ